ncbi:hypothetical protein GCM10022223_69720 [Kineosporia mesophila]|uniref:Carrier domain-containing protein n=1 Tax=Kineosporia mesophila TaxID=566012 RepID=A0ABP7ATV5_9ACTN|nr:acyl carrier protein [Kineosporia mesophila]
MTRNQIFATVVEFATAVGDQVSGQAIALDDTPLSVHGLSSIGLLQLFTQLEDHFGIRISDGDGLRAGSALDVVDLVERKLGAREAS